MTATTLIRGKVTTHIIDVLSTLGFPVGDGESPTAPHGWQGEPNSTGTNFIPWTTLAAGNAANSSGPLSATQADWKAIYFVTNAGVTRKQVESLADTARDLLVKAERTVITTGKGDWKIQQVRVPAIGGVTRIGQVSPSYFIQTDTIEVWLSKELA